MWSMVSVAPGACSPEAQSREHRLNPVLKTACGDYHNQEAFEELGKLKL